MIISTNVFRRILPVGVFLTAFTVVMTLLMSMDIRAARRRKFLNLSQDLEFRSVYQDNEQLISYIQAVHFRLSQPAFLLGNIHSATTAPMHIKIVLRLLSQKENGTFVEAGAYRHGRPSDTEWLERKLDWRGLLLQPDPVDYLTLRKHFRPHALSIHGCLSSTTYPKEITFRQSSDENGVFDINEIDQTRHLFARVKCFPLYSLLLAANLTTLDYLSLDAEGAELQVLQTLPMNRVNIKIMGVRWRTKDVEFLRVFLISYGYTFVQNVGQTYIFIKNKNTRDNILYKKIIDMYKI